MKPMPPCCARAIARCDSVTVSMAALTTGMLRAIRRVTQVRVSACVGRTPLRAGSSRTSSNVRPSGMVSGTILYDTSGGLRVQRSVRHEEVVSLQTAFPGDVLAVVETARLVIAGVGTECKFQPLLFHHRDEFLMRGMGHVVDLDGETSPFQGRDDLLHSLLGPQGVIIARNADRQE